MVHIIQNDPQVPPGNLLDSLTMPYLLHHAYRGDTLPENGAITALIVLGGSMGANDDKRHPFLTSLKQLVREVVAAGKPYLGICLGGQLLAAALGAQVVSKRWEELGTLKVLLTQEGIADKLFKGFSCDFTTFQWHHDSFDLPEGGVLLAASESCPHQAFRVGAAAWGVQFHPEVTGEIIRVWCDWDETTRIKADALVKEFAQNQEKYRASSKLLFANFIAAASLHNLRKKHPSIS